MSWSLERKRLFKPVRVSAATRKPEFNRQLGAILAAIASEEGPSLEVDLQSVLKVTLIIIHCGRRLKGR